MTDFGGNLCVVWISVLGLRRLSRFVQVSYKGEKVQI